MRVLILLAGCLLASCGVSSAGGNDTNDPVTSTEKALPPGAGGYVTAFENEAAGVDEDESMVDLADVPEAAKAAAQAAVPGLVLEEAEKEGTDTYCLHGTADGVFTEVEVDGSGKVLEIEQGPDDD